MNFKYKVSRLSWGSW